MGLTHFDENGAARMVDVSAKDETLRIAVADGTIRMKPATLAMIADKNVAKGDVLATAQLAGIMAAKKTPALIPLCHAIPLTGVDLILTVDETASTVTATATIRAVGKTGAEMEALTAVTVALMTVYDMVKAVDKEMVITDVSLREKSGGASGHFIRDNNDGEDS